MSVESRIEDIIGARNVIRTKMRAAGQASSNDKLAILATNLTIGQDTSDATATADDILEGKTAYINNLKVTGTMAIASEADARAIARFEY